jgi:hypothetical protein
MGIKRLTTGAKGLWRAIGHASNIQFLWQILVPAGVAASVSGFLAFLKHQPVWLDLIAALGAGAMASIVMMGVLAWRNKFVFLHDRHRHHADKSIGTAPEASMQMEVTRAPAAQEVATPPFPERHKEIVQSLADPLSRLEHVSLDRAAWRPQSGPERLQEHFDRFNAAKEEAERLIGQIPYDPSTVHTVRDFIHACSLAREDIRRCEDERESRSDVYRISPGLFRFLHEGRSVDRQKVDLPDWCRVNEGKAATSADTEADASTSVALGAGKARTDWLPFNKALYYLVYDSLWGEDQAPVANEDEFNNVVCAEVRERLAREEIAARGRLGWGDECATRATEEIPARYWIDAYFAPFGLIASATPKSDAACKQGGGAEKYSWIILREDDVRRVWPARQSGTPTELSTAVEALRATCAEGNAELERRRRAKSNGS